MGMIQTKSNPRYTRLCFPATCQHNYHYIIKQAFDKSSYWCLLM